MDLDWEVGEGNLVQEIGEECGEKVSRRVLLLRGHIDGSCSMGELSACVSLGMLLTAYRCSSSSRISFLPYGFALAVVPM